MDSRRAPSAQVARQVLWIVGLCATLPTIAVQAQRAPGADERAIREARSRSNRAIARHDTAGIIAEMMPDVFVFSSASLQMSGRHENARRFADQFARHPGTVYRRSPDSIAVFTPWGMAAEFGAWEGEWIDADGPVRISGPYFAKWQRIGPTWRIQSEIYVPTSCRGGAYCRTLPVDTTAARR